MNVINNSPSYEVRKKIFSVLSEWGKQNDCVPQESYLRLSKPLQNGVGHYTFDPSVKAIVQGDKSLSEGDVFFGLGNIVGLMLDTDPVRTGAAPILTYPLLVSAASRGFIAEDIFRLYYGILTRRTVQTQLNEGFPVAKFRVTPETQPTFIIDADGVSHSLGLQPEYDYERAINWFAINFVMNGKDSNMIELDFNGTDANFAVAEADQTTVSTTHKPYLVYEEFGFLMKGAANADVKNSLESFIAARLKW
ncbi:MAG: hypothetical protein LBS50_08690 [Prevotellaceae bacterium]|jgi:hypothetical protein|nr:hypothetical protein [Prevotellaceae bacterium]